jgi:phytoene/squalene synthetase
MTSDEADATRATERLPNKRGSAACGLRACHEILTRGSKSFVAASRMLPKRLHDRTAALYAFCRVADDAVDLGTDVQAAIARLHQRLDRVYAGAPEPDPVDRAFCDVVHTCGIPQAIPRALIEGFEWDAQRRRYATGEELDAYCARVAATVGVMMTLLFGERSKVLLARACDLGLAMQLTNICRDVGEDARAGRIYLPLDWLAEAGVDKDELIARPAHSPALGSVVKRVLDRADACYRRADLGMTLYPYDCRLGVAPRASSTPRSAAWSPRTATTRFPPAPTPARRASSFCWCAPCPCCSRRRRSSDEPANPAVRFRRRGLNAATTTCWRREKHIRVGHDRDIFDGWVANANRGQLAVEPVRVPSRIPPAALIRDAVRVPGALGGGAMWLHGDHIRASLNSWIAGDRAHAKSRTSSRRRNRQPSPCKGKAERPHQASQGWLRVIITNHGTPVADLVAHGTGAAPAIRFKRPGRFAQTFRLKGKGPALSELVLKDRVG